MLRYLIFFINSIPERVHYESLRSLWNEDDHSLAKTLLCLANKHTFQFTLEIKAYYITLYKKCKVNVYVVKESSGENMQ